MNNIKKMLETSKEYFDLPNKNYLRNVATDIVINDIIKMSGDISGKHEERRKHIVSKSLEFLKRQSIDNKRKIVAISADTMIYSEPFNESNFQKHMKKGLSVSGEGGTSFVESLNEALKVKNKIK